MEVIVTLWYVSCNNIWCCCSLSKVVVLSRITTTNCSTVLLLVPTAYLTFLGIVGGCGADTPVALRLRNAADYRLFYFSTTCHQTRAFLISVNNKKWFCGLVWQFWKRRGVWADWVYGGLIPWLHSALGMLQTTAYLLLDHMAPN